LKKNSVNKASSSFFFGKVASRKITSKQANDKVDIDNITTITLLTHLHPAQAAPLLHTPASSLSNSSRDSCSFPEPLRTQKTRPE
jgi:hypothetical protein